MFFPKTTTSIHYHVLNDQEKQWKREWSAPFQSERYKNNYSSRPKLTLGWKSFTVFVLYLLFLFLNFLIFKNQYYSHTVK